MTKEKYLSIRIRDFNNALNARDTSKELNFESVIALMDEFFSPDEICDAIIEQRANRRHRGQMTKRQRYLIDTIQRYEKMKRQTTDATIDTVAQNLDTLFNTDELNIIAAYVGMSKNKH